MADQHDEQNSSLRGRGRDLMRGTEGDSNPSSETGGGWLPTPPPQDEGNGETYFEDENDLLKWMEVDPEQHRPTVAPNKRLLEQPITTDDLYPEPDFDAIFGSDDDEDEEMEIQAPIGTVAEIPADEPVFLSSETQTLDTIFQADDPSFDDIFGDVFQEEAPADELPVPETDDLVAEANPFEEEEIPTPFVADGPTMPLDYRSLPDPDNFAEVSFEDDLPETALFSETPEEEYFEDELPELPSFSEESFSDEFEGELPDMPGFGEESFEEGISEPSAFAQAESFSDEFEDELPDWADDSRDTQLTPLIAEDDIDERDIPTAQPNLEDEDAISDVVTEMPEGEATSILSERFYDDDQYASPDEQAAFDLLDEMKGDIEEDYSETSPFAEDVYEAEPVEYLDDEQIEDVPESIWGRESAEATAFGEATEILKQRFYEDDEDASTHEQAAFNLLDEMTGEIELPPQSEAQAFVSMLEIEQKPTAEEKGAITALVEPLELQPIETRSPIAEIEPFALAPQTVHELDAVPYDPSMEYDSAEAIPLGEGDTSPIDLRGANIQTMGLMPEGPETFEGTDDFLAEEEEPEKEVFMVEDFAEETGGGTMDEELPEEVALEVTRGAEIKVTSPLEQAQNASVRVSSKDMFQPSTIAPNQDLLGLFVDDNRLRELFEQIEALQEDIVTNVRGDRGNSDIYQEELLLASNLLLSSRENYDEARAIAYRVRADLNRERRVEVDIQRWAPQIMAIYIVIFIGFWVLFFMGGLFTSLGESTGADWVGYAYIPTLMGLAGAWVAGIWTLYYETLVYRNFDSIRNSWYIFNNPLGGLMSGFLVYLILAVATTVTVNSDGFEAIGKSPVTWVLAVAVGFYQDSLIQALGDFRRRFISDSSESSSSREITRR